MTLTKSMGVQAKIVLIMLIGGLFYCSILLSSADAEEAASDIMPKSWLREKTTVENVERENLVFDERLGPDPIVFGYINKEWGEFKSNIRPGDELWKFSSSKESWEHLAGRAGFCVVRDGVIVDALVTRMN